MEERAQHSICPYIVLGLATGSPRSQVNKTYEQLIEMLEDECLSKSPQAWVQAQQAKVAVDDAYQRIYASDERELSEQCKEQLSQEFHPKLGQMLVAAGLISLPQLEEAIAKQTIVNLPLGEILKSSSLITQIELDNFLINQRLIKLPPDSPYLFGQRLLGLGLITEDMLCVSLIEQRNTGKPLGQILVERCWLSQEILDVLLNSQLSDNSKNTSNRSV